MLTLTRRIGDSLRIGDDVSIMVLDIQDDEVQLRIKAPKIIKVHREEIYRRIQQEKQQSIQAPEPQKNVEPTGNVG